MLDAFSLAADLVEVARRYAVRDHRGDRRRRSAGYRRHAAGGWVPPAGPPV